MPVLVAAAHHEGSGGDWRADGPGVDQLATGLESATQEGVGRTADAQPFGGRQFEHRLALRAGEGEGLLAVDLLAGGQGGHRYRRRAPAEW